MGMKIKVIHKPLSTLLFLWALIAILVMLSIGCAPRVIYVRPPPPPPKHETIPPRPNPTAVWVSGHWQWSGTEYVWISGGWELHPKGGAWVPGHWRKTPKGWEWSPGRWVK